jgi:crotonobetainyl-CoA:carnitine CoA-transferase CaiB-like acyl-CoA transferase
MQDSSVREDRPGPLRGLRVVDWSQGFGGPLCARLLGDLGADVGIQAIPSLHAGDLMNDAHLAARGFFQQVDHPGMGPRPVYSAPFRFGLQPLPVRRPSPTLGQHNLQVLGDLLGTSQEQLGRYESAGILS